MDYKYVEWIGHTPGFLEYFGEKTVSYMQVYTV